MRLAWVGHKVNAAFGEGDATEEALGGKPPTLAGAVKGDSLFSILRTRGIELADASPDGRKPEPVGAD